MKKIQSNFFKQYFYIIKQNPNNLQWLEEFNLQMSILNL